MHCKPSGEPRIAFVISVINVIGSKYTFVAEGSTVDERQEGYHKPAGHWSITITETSHAAVKFHLKLSSWLIRAVMLVYSKKKKEKGVQNYKQSVVGSSKSA